MQSNRSGAQPTGRPSRHLSGLLLVALAVMPIAGGSRAVVIGEEDRRSIAEHAALTNESVTAVRERYAATGQLRCRSDESNRSSTANVTLEQNIITLAAHSLTDIETCEPKFEGGDQYVLTVYTNEGTFTSRIAEVLQTGFACDGSELTNDRNASDWAAAILDRSLPVAPYAVAESSVEYLVGVLLPQDGETMRAPVISVAAGHGDIHNTVGSSTKTITTCNVRDFRNQNGTYFVKSDCDVAAWSSGGGLFTIDNTPLLLGITVGWQIPEDLKKGDLGRQVLQVPYDSADAYGFHILVDKI